MENECTQDTGFKQKAFQSLTLGLLLVLIPLASGTSSCSTFIQRCHCADGSYQIITDLEQFKVDRADPNSCCYSPPIAANGGGQSQYSQAPGYSIDYLAYLSRLTIQANSQASNTSSATNSGGVGIGRVIALMPGGSSDTERKQHGIGRVIALMPSQYRPSEPTSDYISNSQPIAVSSSKPAIITQTHVDLTPSQQEWIGINHLVTHLFI